MAAMDRDIAMANHYFRIGGHDRRVVRRDLDSGIWQGECLNCGKVSTIRRKLTRHGTGRTYMASDTFDLVTTSCTAVPA